MPPSLVAVPPSPMMISRAPRSIASRMSIPTPLLLAIMGLRRSRGVRFRPMALAASMIATLSFSFQQYLAVTGFP